MDLVIERNGQKLVREDFPLVPREYPGYDRLMYGLTFTVQEATPFTRLQQSWYSAVDMVRLVKISLVDLFSGRAGIKDMSGPIGIVNAIGEVGAESHFLLSGQWDIYAVHAQKAGPQI